MNSMYPTEIQLQAFIMRLADNNYVKLTYDLYAGHDMINPKTGMTNTNTNVSQYLCLRQFDFNFLPRYIIYFV